VRTGDILGYHGVSWLSKTIEFFTGRRDQLAWSHVAVFYWDGAGLWVAQEYEGVGFTCQPASQLIGKLLAEHGNCYWGAAPVFITDNSRGILELISTYRVTPQLRPYGYGSLVRILFGGSLDPSSVQAVCSIFAQQAWERCGYKFSRLFAPEDFKRVITNINSIE